MAASPTRILLIEDNPGDAELTRDRLAEASIGDFEVRRAATLGDTLALLSGSAADAIILDLDLPDSKGLKTITKVLEFAGSAPVIVVSGTIDERLRAEVSDAGADDVYTKDEANSRLFPRSLLHVIERRRARERQTQIEALLDTTPDAILVTNLEGVVRYVNQAALAMFHRERSDFIGELLGFSVRDGQPSEIRITHGGGARICEMRVVAFQWQGEPAFVAVIRDVTQQKHLEAQLLMNDRLVSMGTLAAGVAHEINNPLAAVVANVTVAIDELARMSGASVTMNDVLDGLRDTRDAAQQIRQIVRDLKVYSRADEDVRQEVDIHTVLDSVARMAWHEVRQRARLVKDYGDTLPVAANESRLSQVFLNLVINAAQAIQGKAEENEIRLRTSIDDSGRVVVEVRDTGSGIPPEVQRRIFAPFVTTKPVGSGTGLGLAICQRIINGVGGELTFTSEVGKGTCFTVRLPVAQRRPRITSTSTVVTDPTPPANTPAPQPEPVRHGRILIIDDDAMVLQALRRTLGRAHNLECEDRAVAALDRLRGGERYDLILCDMMMPEMTGVAFCNALEALAPEQAERLVFLTGGAVSDEAHEFFDRGNYVRLEKPFDLGTLREIVARFVRGAK